MVLPIPPAITVDMAKGLTLYMLKAMFSGLSQRSDRSGPNSVGLSAIEACRRLVTLYDETRSIAPTVPVPKRR